MIYISIFLLSLFLTFTYKKVAKKKAVLAEVNSRSSHTLPTVTGGGVAIVLSFYVAIFYLFFNNLLENNLFFALLGGLILAVVGFLDDLRELSVKVRIFSQVSSVLMVFYFLGVFDRFNFIIVIFLFFASIWLINLYNFMDGIDGYAASEAIFVLVGAYMIYQNPLFLILAASVSGFLVFNWQKASIFMGDIGSTFLGFVFVVFALKYFNNFSDLVIWYMLLGVFIFDATYTLIRRLVSGENLSQAHKKHIFQRVNQLGFSHQKVVLYAMGINLVVFLFLILTYKSISLYFIFVGYNISLFAFAKYIDKKRSFDD